MNKLVLLALFLLVVPVMADTQQEIDHLLDFVARTDCQYDRNGTIHSGNEARDHINRKYKYYEDKINTAEDFIKYSATRSKFSGRKYKIRCAGLQERNAADWLLEELHAFRQAEHENGQE